MVIELCLAIAIFFEARDQPIDGQMAIAEVIMNRVADERWPNNVCDVIDQPRQFSFIADGQSINPRDYNEPDAWIVSLLVAKSALLGINLVGISSLYYHHKDLNVTWDDNLLIDGTIGDHIFYSD